MKPSCRRKRPSNYVRHTDNAGAAEADQRHIANCSKRFHASANALSLLCDLCSYFFRSKAVANPDWNGFGQDWPKRLGMQNLRSEIGKLRRLSIRDFWNCARLGDQTRVS